MSWHPVIYYEIVPFDSVVSMTKVIQLELSSFEMNQVLTGKQRLLRLQNLMLIEACRLYHAHRSRTLKPVDPTNRLVFTGV